LNLNRERFRGHIGADDEQIPPYHIIPCQEDKDRTEEENAIEGNGRESENAKIAYCKAAVDNPMRMDEERQDRETDDGIKERDNNENDLPRPCEDDIDLVEVVVLKDQDDEKRIQKKEKEFRRCDIRIPMSGTYERYAPELERSRESDSQEDKIHYGENKFITRVFHSARINCLD
jgi:hypothetical protein